MWNLVNPYIGKKIKMNICNIKKTFDDYYKFGWNKIYILVDVHGTIVPHSSHKTNSLTFVNDVCKEVLQNLSSRNDVCLILWSSTHINELEKIIEWLGKNSININYANFNPECLNTEYGDYTKKPYYNILIDDRAGFDPDFDWINIKNTLKEINEWK